MTAQEGVTAFAAQPIQSIPESKMIRPWLREPHGDFTLQKHLLTLRLHRA